MQKQPAVTVIIIFYNTVRFLAEAVESVLAQTFTDWELLLVDDGSSDGSTEIGQYYARTDPKRIFYLAHEQHRNCGASAARNLGIKHARGEYIALLDADDVWLPHKLERQVEILNRWPEAALLYGNTQYWYSWTKRSEDSGRDFQPGIKVPSNTLLQPPALLARMLRQEIPVPCTCSLLLRRAAVLSVGGFEDSFRRVFTDQVFYAKLLLKWPVVASSECWDRYRQHPDSCVSQVEAQGGIGAARQRYLRWLKGYLVEQNAQRTEVWRAVQTELWNYQHPHLMKMTKISQRFNHQAGEQLKAILRQALPTPTYAWLKTQLNLRRSTDLRKRREAE